MSRWMVIGTAVVLCAACAHSNRSRAAKTSKADEPAQQETKSEQDKAKYRITPTRDPNSPSGIYIPADLDDAFRELDRMLSKEFREEFRRGTEDDTSQYHFGLGLWMRNNWGLWGGSRLAKSLQSLGMRHPDDMSGVIIMAYWRRLNGKDL